MKKKLYRNMENRLISGVCSGVADFFDIDPTIVRVIWSVIALTSIGVPVYIICALIIPTKPTNIIDA